MTLPPDSASGHVPTAVASGDIDIATRHEVVDLVRGALHEGVTDIRLDMADVVFIDCAGLGGVLEARRLAAGRGCHLQVVSPSAPVHRLLVLTNTLSVLTESGPRRSRQ